MSTNANHLVAERAELRKTQSSAYQRLRFPPYTTQCATPGSADEVQVSTNLISTKFLLEGISKNTGEIFGTGNMEIATRLIIIALFLH
jgi:hypothetical protein